MTILLAFDTATHHCAATLLWDNRLVTRVEPMTKRRAGCLVSSLEQVSAPVGLIR